MKRCFDFGELLFGVACQPESAANGLAAREEDQNLTDDHLGPQDHSAIGWLSIENDAQQNGNRFMNLADDPFINEVESLGWLHLFADDDPANGSIGLLPEQDFQQVFQQLFQ